GQLDPSGLVKGWAIHNAAKLISGMGCHNFYIEAGGDIQASGVNAQGKPWLVGIRNPFNIEQIIKVLHIRDEGVATSGTYVRGEHIYNPKAQSQAVSTVKSLTVVGPNVYEADRFATAAFAMGTEGIAFIERLPGFEVYMVDNNQIATFTSGFEAYVAKTD
ncbi:MAG TPA: FAD:protein FMN transferase, partial [Candidatus Saccharimonadales bacterium]|nr:FAD:protein FMN transferase [Candidatus Saccharimonadales bacterium]